MNTSNWIYYKFLDLPAEPRQRFNIKSPNRLDCISANNPQDYKGLTFFVNGKGQLYLYKTPAKNISRSDPRRRADWALTGKSINLTSLFIDLPDYPQYAYGYGPYSQYLGKKKDKPNPLYAFRNDLYLFILNADYSELEIIIIPDGKNLWNSFYLKLIQGEFDKQIDNLRDNAIPFFDYGL